ASARDQGLELDLLHAVERTNQRQKRALLSRAVRHFGENLEGKSFAVWGLSFKPGTDDMREAPSIDLVEGLLSRGARVQVHDPVSARSARRHFGGRVAYAPSCYAAVEGSDGLFVVTEWNEFRKPDLMRVRRLMRQPVVFDGRNIFDPKR